MILPIFDLAAKISEYNKQYETYYEMSESFGYTFFDPVFLEQANNTIQLINEGHNLHAWSAEELSQIKKNNQALGKKLSYCKGVIKTNVDLNTCVPHREEIKKNNDKLCWYTWLQSQHERLTRADVWSEWLANPLTFNPPLQRKLKKQWEKYAIFARFNPSALVLTARDYLPNLIEYHQTALKKLKFAFFLLPKELYKDYGLYLKDFLNKAKMLKEQLAESMFARLRALDKTGFKHSNAFLHLHQQLIEVGINELPKGLVAVEEKITEEQFSYFHQYIQQHGNANLKARLKELSWFYQGGLLPTQVISLDQHENFLVPTALVNDVFAGIAWPQSIFKGASIRRNFFKHKGFFLAFLKGLADTNSLEIRLEQLDAFVWHLAEIQEREKEINNELSKLRGGIYDNLSKLFHKKTLKFLATWKINLGNYQVQLLERKVLLAERLLAVICQQPASTKDATKFPWQACVILQKLIAEISAAEQEKDNLILVNLHTRMQAVIKNSKDLLALHEVYSVVEKLANEKLITKSELSFLDDYINNVRASNDVQIAAFIEYNKPFLSKLLKNLHHELKKQPIEFAVSVDLAQHTAMIDVLYKVLKRFDVPEINEELENLLKDKFIKYFLKYLEVIINCQGDFNKLNENLLSIEKLEGVINSIGKNIYYADKSLTDHVGELKELRDRRSISAFFVRASTLAKYIAEEYLEKCVDKDFNTFKNHITLMLKKTSQLAYSDNMVACLDGIKKSVREKGFDRVESIIADLPVHQKQLLAVNGKSPVPVMYLVNLELKLDSIRQESRSGTKNIMQKLSVMDELRHFLENTLQVNPKTRSKEYDLKSKSGRRTLFFKSYLQIPLLEIAGNKDVNKDCSKLS